MKASASLFMEIELKVWLYDCLNAIEEIVHFVNDISDFSAYQNDLKTRRAVERNLVIIGEAVSRILKKVPFVPISNRRQIIDTRNRIVHGYDTISDEIIWNIVTRYLPILKKEIMLLL